MKLVRRSPHVAGAFDSYQIIGINVDKIGKRVSFTIVATFINPDGTAHVRMNGPFDIKDIVEYIVDPEWNENSNPPKPKGFDPMNINTWGGLSKDDIPRVVNTEKLYATKIIEGVEKGESIEDLILRTAIKIGLLPDCKEWFIR